MFKKSIRYSKYTKKVKIAISKMKNTLHGSVLVVRLKTAKEGISELEDIAIKIF